MIDLPSKESTPNAPSPGGSSATPSRAGHSASVESPAARAAAGSERSKPLANPHHFLLFVAGSGELGQEACANFERLVRPALRAAGIVDEAIHLEIVDLCQRPTVGREYGVLASPMLVRTSPGPAVRLLGVLEHREAVLTELGLSLDSPVEDSPCDGTFASRLQSHPIDDDCLEKLHDSNADCSPSS